MIITGAFFVLVAGSLLILWSKGFFSTTADHRRDESRFTKFAADAEGTWEAEPPTALANSVNRQIDECISEYGDPRFTELKSQFLEMQGQNSRGAIDHSTYQQRLVQLQQATTTLLYEVDPSLLEENDAE